MKKFVWFILAVFTLGMLYLLYIIGRQPLTNNEVTLYTVLLTIISIIATWIASYYYSESTYKTAVDEVDKDHQTKLKTYALKAAEKVNNLSSELNKLSLYLQEELESEYDNLQQENYSREERIKSAIHIVGTLKSVNDTALSDWKGVIGDELEEQEEEKKEREDALLEIIERYESLLNDLKNDVSHSGNSEYENELRQEITSVKKNLAMVINNLSGTITVRPKLISKTKEEVSHTCPTCTVPLNYRQRPKKNSIKFVVCKNCNTKLLSRWIPDKGFMLEIENNIDEKIECPSCKTEIIFNLSSFPNKSESINCNNCNNLITVTRRINDILIKSQKPSLLKQQISEDVDELFIETVKQKLPAQPWPQGIHKTIADELNISSTKVHSAINELMKRGDFHFQLNGKIYQEIIR